MRAGLTLRFVPLYLPYTSRYAAFLSLSFFLSLFSKEENLFSFPCLTFTPSVDALFNRPPLGCSVFWAAGLWRVPKAQC